MCAFSLPDPRRGRKTVFAASGQENPHRKASTVDNLDGDLAALQRATKRRVFLGRGLRRALVLGPDADRRRSQHRPRRLRDARTPGGETARPRPRRRALPPLVPTHDGHPPLFRGVARLRKNFRRDIPLPDVEARRQTPCRKKRMVSTHGCGQTVSAPRPENSGRTLPFFHWNFKHCVVGTDRRAVRHIFVPKTARSAIAPYHTLPERSTKHRWVFGQASLGIRR